MNGAVATASFTSYGHRLRPAPITSYFGPGLVLYLVADLAASRGTLEPLGAAIAVAAALLSLSPLWVGPDRSAAGASQFAWLGVSAGLALVRYVDHAQMSLAADLSHAIGIAVLATLLVDMAIHLPDPLPWPRQRWARRLPAWLGFIGGLWLVGSHLPAPPPAWLLRVPASAYLVIPPVGPHAAEAWLAASVLLALWLRLSRRALGGAPEMLACNAWGTLGLLPAAALSVVVGAMTAFGHPWPAGQLAPAFSVVAGVAVLGHGRLINADRRLQAGSSTRAVLALGLAVALLSTVAAVLMPFLPRSPIAFGCAVAASLFLGLSVHKTLLEVTDVVLAPAHGVLLRALSESASSLDGARHFDVLAGRVLRALRAGSGSAKSEPTLYIFDPPLGARVDQAGQPHLSSRSLSSEIITRLRQTPGEVITRGSVERMYAKMPPLRGLLDALVRLDALCVAPLVIEGETEGALVLPRGRRRSALTLEEAEALKAYAHRVATQAAVLLAERRAHERASAAARDAASANTRAQGLEDELKARNREVRMHRLGPAAVARGSAPVAYSPAMRRLQRAVDALAESPAPLLLQAPSGSRVVELAQRIHNASERATRPFVVADCAGVAAEDAAYALLGSAAGSGPGDGPAPGYVEVAGDGTLVLLNLPALSMELQERLASMLVESRRKRGVRRRGRAQEPVLKARVLATVQAAPATLIEEGRLAAGLVGQFLPDEVVLPALRNRQEDLESLVLLSIDRACRIHGKSPVGLEPEARERLFAYAWPGDEAELDAVMERAVAQCDGRRIAADGLGEALAPARDQPTPSAAKDPLSGTYEAIERRALQRALRDASGNKSEAARALGLKRTTFLDKLRRHRFPSDRPQADAS